MTSLYAPDINRLRRRLRGLSESALLRTLQEQLETIGAAALAADNTGRYVAANQPASMLTGYSLSELLGLSVRDLTPPMRQDAGELWSAFIQVGWQAGDYVLRRKDGSPIGVHYSAFASVAPGVHVAVLTPLEVPSSI